MNENLVLSILDDLNAQFTNKTLLSHEDLKSFLGCDDSTIYNWSRRKVQPPRMIVGRTVRYSKRALAQWLATEVYRGA